MKTIDCNLCGSNEYKILYTIKKFATFRIVKCKKCGLVYVNPQPTNLEISKMYDKDYFHGKGFDKGVMYVNSLTDKYRKSAYNIHNSRLKNIEKYVTKGKILDLGCGVGDFLDVAKKNKWKPFGVELSPFASKIAKEKFKVNVFTGKVADARFPNDNFNAINMAEVIEHLSDPASTLKECNRILSKKGVIVIQTGDVESVYAKFKGKNWPYFIYGHIFYFSRNTITKMLNKTGFKVIKIYNGDEVPISARLILFWAYKNKKNPIHILESLFLILMQTIRKSGLGGMTVYARKV